MSLTPLLYVILQPAFKSFLNLKTSDVDFSGKYESENFQIQIKIIEL